MTIPSETSSPSTGSTNTRTSGTGSPVPSSVTLPMIQGGSGSSITGSLALTVRIAVAEDASSSVPRMMKSISSETRNDGITSIKNVCTSLPFTVESSSPGMSQSSSSQPIDGTPSIMPK